MYYEESSNRLHFWIDHLFYLFHSYYSTYRFILSETEVIKKN